MEEVPENAQQVPAITELDLSGNRIKTYTSLITYPQLVHLNLSHNALTGSLYAEVCARLVCLRTLDISHNRLTSIAAVEILRNTLVELNAAHNRLRLLTGVDACYNLNSLDISGNLLARGVRECGLVAVESLHKLRVLDFRGNAVCEVAGVMTEIRTLLPYVTSLNGRDIQPRVTPHVSAVLTSSVDFPAEQDVSPALTKPPAEAPELVLFRRSLDESIARKERLLRKLPIVFC